MKRSPTHAPHSAKANAIPPATTSFDHEAPVSHDGPGKKKPLIHTISTETNAPTAGSCKRSFGDSTPTKMPPKKKLPRCASMNKRV